MRLLLDENLPPKWERLLADIFTEHRFSSVSKVGLAGTDDVSLFPAIAAANWDGIITGDVMQMDRQVERDALRSAGLLWIGIESKQVKGLAGPRLQLATLLAGLALLDAEWTTGTAYRIRHVGHSLGSRVVSFAL